MPLLLDLFLTFLKIGAVSFGGGYAMIPVISDEVISHAWMLESEVINFVAIAESTPGPIAVNMATLIGTQQAGILGAIFATLGVVLPAFIIILIVASVLSGLLKFAGVQGFLSGVRPVVISLIMVTGLLILCKCVLSTRVISDPIGFDWKNAVILVLIFLVHYLYKVITKKNISPIVLILFSAGLGIFFYGVI